MENKKLNLRKETIIEVKDLYKDFFVGDNVINALRGINFEVRSKDFIVIFGPSGCGKSTLLNLILGIDTPTSGTIKIGGADIFQMTEDERANYRARKLGMVYQMPYWIKTLNVLENVALPLIIKGIKLNSALERVHNTMLKLKIEELINQIPTELSGGEQQKVGLARAIVSNPWTIMADEPTGNLDTLSATEIMQTLKFLNEEEERTIILVTHNKEYWDYGNRKIEMEDGKIIKDSNYG